MEYCFGYLKKRFKCLIALLQLHSLGGIDNQFFVCCMIHNMLLKYHGYEDKDYKPDVHRRGNKPQGILLPAYEETQTGTAVSQAEENAWVQRIKYISYHYNIVGDR